MNDLLKDVDYDIVAGPESRGFIFGVPVAYANGKGFVPVRNRVSFLVKLYQRIIHLNMELQLLKCIRML